MVIEGLTIAVGGPTRYVRRALAEITEDARSRRDGPEYLTQDGGAGGGDSGREASSRLRVTDQLRRTGAARL